MHGTKFKQLFHSGSQITVTHSSEVIKGEEVKVLSQVTWQAVELVPHPEGHTHTNTHTARTHTQVMSVFCAEDFAIIVKLKTCTSRHLTL